MICSYCLKDFPENEIEESHDVPCYLFEGNERRIRKSQADKWGRRWLCRKHHRDYELFLATQLLSTLSQSQKGQLKLQAKEISIRYFKEEEIKKDGTNGSNN